MLSKIRVDAGRIPKTVGYRIIKGIATLGDEEEACTRPEWAYKFALYIPGADIVKCCESACKDPIWAYRFALIIPGADIVKCCETSYTRPYLAYCFALTISGVDKERCRKACEGTEYAF